MEIANDGTASVRLIRLPKRAAGKFWRSLSEARIRGLDLYLLSGDKRRERSGAACRCRTPFDRVAAKTFVQWRREHTPSRSS
jgi:hypothetical protein